MMRHITTTEEEENKKKKKQISACASATDLRRCAVRSIDAEHGLAVGAENFACEEGKTDQTLIRIERAQKRDRKMKERKKNKKTKK